jgi:phosphoesterase RecJ-like protein
MNSTFAEIEAALKGVQNILVASHLRPDGDALGSTIAFSLWLKSLGKNVTAWNEEGVLQKFRYLPGHDMVTIPDATPREFDAVVALDNSVKNRLGKVWESVASSKLVVNIDHHISNDGYGDLNYIDPTSPATGQILFEFFKDRGVTITPEIAGNLYAAISTDTGSFQYLGTNARTFVAGAGLIEAGVDVAKISRQMYESQPMRRLELLRYALNQAKFDCDGHLASFSLPISAVEEMGVLPEDNEGIIDHLRSVDGVVAAVFFEELGDGMIRVSSRSKDERVDVCKICKQFGGGGHPLAAGARIKGSLSAVEEMFLEAVCHEIRNRN